MNFKLKMHQNFKNVHIYDGLLSDYKPSKAFTNEEKIIAFKKFMEKSKNPYALQMVQIMLSDFLMGVNKDDKNNIDWADLFADIMQHKDVEEMFIPLEEQLHDARLLGPCAQGRTTRLLQIWRALPS